jgi:hypothetical protein
MDCFFRVAYAGAVCKHDHIWSLVLGIMSQVGVARPTLVASRSEATWVTMLRPQAINYGRWPDRCHQRVMCRPRCRTTWQSGTRHNNQARLKASTGHIQKIGTVKNLRRAIFQTYLSMPSQAKRHPSVVLFL